MGFLKNILIGGIEMKTLLLAQAILAQSLNLDTGIPIYILIPLIMVIAIGAVVTIQWIYKKMNK